MLFQRPSTDNVPVVTLDDRTLLVAEKETRTQHARANSAVVGASVSLALLSPMAVFGIAKSARRSRRSLWSHSELLAEVRRRGLTPLQKTVDESTTALVGGQVAAVVLGHVGGGLVADGLVGPTLDLVTGTVHWGAEKAADKIVTSTVLTGVDSVTGTVVARQGAGASAGTVEENFSLPNPSTAAKSKKKCPYIFTLFPGPEKAVVIAATCHLAGTWSGFGISDLDQEDAAINASQQAGVIRPLPPTPMSTPTYKRQEDEIALVNGSQPFPSTPVLVAEAQSTNMPSTSISKRQSPLISFKSALSTAQSSTTAAISHFQNTTVTTLTTATNALKLAATTSSPQQFKNFTCKLQSRANAVITVALGTTTTQEVVVPVKYRMTFDLVIKGITVSGRNLVDDLAISGRCHESGTRIEFTEVEEGEEGEEDTFVMYRASIAGGVMKGTWESSDGRTGKFSVNHL